MMTDWKDVPPRTPEGEKLFQSRLVGRPGPQKKAVEPAKGNDPIMTCNPKGFPRLLFYTGGQANSTTSPASSCRNTRARAPHVTSGWDWRALPTIRMDDGSGIRSVTGKAIRWLSIRSVSTIRAWLDQWGNVYSADMKFQERWHRKDRDLFLK